MSTHQATHVLAHAPTLPDTRQRRQLHSMRSPSPKRARQTLCRGADLMPVAEEHGAQGPSKLRKAPLESTAMHMTQMQPMSAMQMMPETSSSIRNRPWATGELTPPASPERSPVRDRWSFLSASRDKSDKDHGGPRSPDTKISTSTPNAAPLGPKLSKLADWFQGESAPVSLVRLPSPSRERADPFASQSPTATRQPRPTPKPAGSSSSLFSLFTSSKVHDGPMQDAAGDDDGLWTFDVHDTLYSSPPSLGMNPLETAEALLCRMQATHAREMQHMQRANEQETQNERTWRETNRNQSIALEEERHRTNLLKQQLDDMASQAAARMADIQELTKALDREKRMRHNDAESRTRTLRLVSPMASTSTQHDGQSTASVPNSHGTRASSRMNSNGPESILGSDAQSANAARRHDNRTSREQHGRRENDLLKISRLEESNAELRSRVAFLEHELTSCLHMIGGAAQM